jgi:DMSO reductase family type II enzyme chaperone
MIAVTAEDNRVGSLDWQQTDLYRFFGLVLAPPTRECFNFLSLPEVPAALHGLWKSLECEDHFPGFEWFASYEFYESAYIALFDVGVPEPPIPLFESAHDKSRPAQEIVLENTYFYEVLGLRSDPGKAVPDYLVTQLEFLAALRYTGEHTAEEATAVSMLRAESDFIERHLLNWIPVAKSKLGKTGAPGFPVLMTLLAAFLSRRHDGRKVRTTRHSPPIGDGLR